MSAAHTPTPWSVHHHAEHVRPCINGPHGMLSFIDSGDEDATHIVRCVNERDELLSSIQFALGLLKDGGAISRNAYRMGVLGSQDIAHLRSVLNQALAKAST